MVAYSGYGWRLAPSLVALFKEADRRFPNRSEASDGTIGDRSHRNRYSDHNPDSSGDVLAGDLTHDPAHGCDMQALMEHLRLVRDPRVKYLIWNYRICASYPVSGYPAWAWRRYSGSNGHTHHAHISVKDTWAAKSDTSSWFDGGEEDMPLSDEDLDKIARRVRLLLNEGTGEGRTSWAHTNKTAYSMLQQMYAAGGRAIPDPEPDPDGE